MRVTHSMIGEVISYLFGISATVDEEGVTFGLESDDKYGAQIILCLFDITEEATDTSALQGLHIYLFFDNPDETRLDLSPIGFEQALLLCYTLQEGLDWGTLEIVTEEEERLTVSLSRTVDITLRDIQMATDRDLHSEFFRTIGRLMEEWELLKPVFHSAITNQIYAGADKKLDEVLYDCAGTA